MLKALCFITISLWDTQTHIQHHYILYKMQHTQYNTVSSRIYAQSVSSQIGMKQGVSVIVIHDSHWVTADFKMTFYPNRGMRAVQNWAYRREDTVVPVGLQSESLRGLCIVAAYDLLKLPALNLKIGL